MALLSCPECERQVSDRAHACPNCGYPIAASVSSPGNASPASGLRNCLDCGGSGRLEKDCPICNGNGRMPCRNCRKGVGSAAYSTGVVESPYNQDLIDCPKCHGDKKVACDGCFQACTVTEKCVTCNGCGQLTVAMFDNLAEHREAREIQAAREAEERQLAQEEAQRELEARQVRIAEEESARRQAEAALASPDRARAARKALNFCTECGRDMGPYNAVFQRSAHSGCQFVPMQGSGPDQRVCKKCKVITNGTIKEADTMFVCGACNTANGLR